MKKYIGFILCCVVLVNSCTCKQKKALRTDIDTSKVQIQFMRFDRAFQQSDTINTSLELKKLRAEYASFYDVYMYQIMRFGEMGDSSQGFITYVNGYYMFDDMKQLYTMVQKAYPNTTVVDEEIKKAYALSAESAPNVRLPKKIAYCIGGLNIGAFTIDTEYVGIALDLYMNNDSFYNQMFDNYIAAKFIREMIAQNVMKAIYNQEYGNPYTSNTNLLYSIIEVGKQQYYLDKTLAHILPEYRIGYSEKQLHWCEENEKEIWKYMADKDLFYSESEQDIRHFIGEQPNTKGMPPESPGNIGAWIGLQIIESYMKEVGGTPSIDALVHTDPKVIMSKSKYKP